MKGEDREVRGIGRLLVHLNQFFCAVRCGGEGGRERRKDERMAGYWRSGKKVGEMRSSGERVQAKLSDG